MSVIYIQSVNCKYYPTKSFSIDVDNHYQSFYSMIVHYFDNDYQYYLRIFLKLEAKSHGTPLYEGLKCKL